MSLRPVWTIVPRQKGLYYKTLVTKTKHVKICPKITNTQKYLFLSLSSAPRDLRTASSETRHQKEHHLCGYKEGITEPGVSLEMRCRHKALVPFVLLPGMSNAIDLTHSNLSPRLGCINQEHPDRHLGFKAWGQFLHTPLGDHVLASVATYVRKAWSRRPPRALEA